ncbi:MAG TPA: L-glyceraldehyde 3-phosphate reductase [Lentisphaeria bacterium]|nr:MAG: L-glyceraldehyde 3-phosphate reductase [Lentisphaerae bacterium GWF2_49_21]HBC89677.1 L-glyceraldehyde 3-phosphate reductase [Lentisphaeria bacterium]
MKKSIKKYVPAENRYADMKYNRCGRSGLKLPAISLGLWHNFGGVDDFENCRKMLKRAFDLGITHFDLANNYGPPAGSAEINFGKILKKDFAGYRDELVISTKAGYYMWPGPYGEWGSRKYILASLEQSLKRMGIDHVDIFYHHRPDPDTPLEESMSALEQAVRQGKAIYAGVSNYRSQQMGFAAKMLKSLGVPCLIHQPSYSMFNRWVEEDGLLDVLDAQGIGCIVFSPLAQGMLTDKYLKGIPEGSRASKAGTFLKKDNVTEEKVAKARALNEIAKARGQTLAQMALAWVMRRKTVTSALIGASSVKQVEDCVACTKNLEFSKEELEGIEKILK